MSVMEGRGFHLLWVVCWFQGKWQLCEDIPKPKRG